MDRITEAAPREYRSTLRREQAEATRTRILDATLRVMAGGQAQVSIPAVAVEAGVSVPTVYRHFPSKAELLAALHPHLAGRAGLERLEDMPLPRSLADFAVGVRAIFARIEKVGLDELAVAALGSPSADEMRRVTMPQRQAAIRRVVDAFAPETDEAGRDRIARLLVVVMSSSALRTWQYMGASADEAASDVDWMVRAVIAAAREEEN